MFILRRGRGTASSTTHDAIVGAQRASVRPSVRPSRRIRVFGSREIGLQEKIKRKNKLRVLVT